MISYATQTFSTQENYAASFMTVYTVYDRFILAEFKTEIKFNK